MSVATAIIKLTNKEQETMAKMADLHAEQNSIPTFTEMVKEFEALVKAKYPNDDLAMIYARCYGIALAHLTKEQMTEIIRNRKAK
jgi:hypothetical protein